MAQAYVTCVETNITFSASGAPLCGNLNMEWSIVVDPSQSELFVVDPVDAVTFIGSGFFILLPLWAAMYGGRVLLKSIN